MGRTEETVGVDIIDDRDSIPFIPRGVSVIYSQQNKLDKSKVLVALQSVTRRRRRLKMPETM